MKLTRKKKATFTTGAIAIALLLSGSLAWQNLDQHKNNSFSTADFEHHIVLVENFKEVTNWKKGEAVTKSVAVRNGEDNNDTNAIYQDGFIRLQFKEYMEIGSREYVYTRHRYMIDTQGNFYRFDTKEAAEAFLATLNLTDHDYDLEDDQRIEKLKGYFDKQEYYYIRTQAHDPNGQYGNYIVTGITGDDMTSIVDGVENHADSSRTDKQHDVKPAQNDQSTYTIKKWDGVESPFDEYVKWQLGSEVITLQEWVAGGKQPVAKWIIDTTSDQGYVYWGQALEHSNVAKIPSTMTPNFLESVTLVKQPTGTANYQINVSMDAVSQDDLKLWTDGNSDIIDMLEDIKTPGSSNNKTLEDLLQELQDLLDEAKLIDQDTLTDESGDKLQNAIENGENTYDNPNTTIEDVIKAIEDLEDAIKNVEPKAEAPGFDLGNKKVGDSINFAGHIYTIVYVDAQNKTALLLGDILSASVIQSMGFEHSSGKVRFNKTGANYQGYEGSYLEEVNEKYYNNYIKSHTDNAYVLPANYEVEEDEGIYTDWKTKDYAYSYVSQTGTKTAFALSVSDINYYEIAPATIVDGLSSWLRSPANSSFVAANIYSDGKPGSSKPYDQPCYVRPGLWISIGD
ncbi:hypothetical protein AOC36_08000 [Erysipelothrix larvae]|uniref:Uncharacterized protein n=1 Tax=Erysipelothrix larvae TaxID=1514105 RepID=A0A0X8H139_9FIRM|nr:hypothetical protein [Erysipelothrix larvae]AMC93929.1 hypothetical protein AOC36_08000 [Erysipelothrix larvae]